MPVPPLPPPYAALFAELEQAGWEVVADRYHAELFGNRVIDLANGWRGVKAVRDRGDWRLSVVVAGLSYSSVVTLAVLEGRELGAASGQEPEEEAAAARKLLARLPDDADAIRCLRRDVLAAVLSRNRSWDTAGPRLPLRAARLLQDAEAMGFWAPGPQDESARKDRMELRHGPRGVRVVLDGDWTVEVDDGDGWTVVTDPDEAARRAFRGLGYPGFSP